MWWQMYWGWVLELEALEMEWHASAHGSKVVWLLSQTGAILGVVPAGDA